MSMADSQNKIKGKSLVELAEQLEASIRDAAREGKSLYEVEKNAFERVLQIGYAAIEATGTGPVLACWVVVYTVYVTKTGPVPFAFACPVRVRFPWVSGLCRGVGARLTLCTLFSSS